MMKKIYTYIALLTITITGAQTGVGVNTTNPQQQLHVAGATAGVRIDGLNTTNNTNNLGIGSSTKVYADADGDLMLGTSTNNVSILFDSADYLQNVIDPTSLVNQTGGGSGFSQAGIPIGGNATSFTLTKPAIIEVNYSISWALVDSSFGPNKRLNDFRARIIQTGLYFRQNTYQGAAVVNDYYGNPINGGPWCITSNCSELGGLLAINGQFYANSNQSFGEFDNYRNTASDYVVLGPGTYTPMFACQLAVGNTIGAGAAKMYIGSGLDELQIIAYYFN